MLKFVLNVNLLEPTSLMNNNDILKQIKLGNEFLLGKIYEDNRIAFINYARKFAINEYDILDVYQESIITFYENIVENKIVDLTSSIKTYIFSIGKYKIYELLRANSKTINRIDDVYNLVDSDLLLENEILTEQQQLLKSSFVKLGKRCQRILELFYLQSKSIKEIMADEKYENENVVKAQKSRCMKTLRELTRQ